MIADTGVAVFPEGTTDAEIAVGLYYNRRKISALRTLASARAVAIGMGVVSPGDLVDVEVAAGRDRDEAELEAAKRALAASAARMSAGPVPM